MCYNNKDPCISSIRIFFLFTWRFILTTRFLAEALWFKWPTSAIPAVRGCQEEERRSHSANWTRYASFMDKNIFYTWCTWGPEKLGQSLSSSSRLKAQSPNEETAFPLWILGPFPPIYLCLKRWYNSNRVWKLGLGHPYLLLGDPPLKFDMSGWNSLTSLIFVGGWQISGLTKHVKKEEYIV